jgi:hypothetical protein
MRSIRTPDGRQLPPDIALHRAGWWIAVKRCSCPCERGPHYRAKIWTRPQRRGSRDWAYGLYFCRPTRRTVVRDTVAYIQQLRRWGPEYWARRAKWAGVPPNLVDAWVHTSAFARRAAPRTRVEAIGKFLVYPATRYDEGDGVVSYRYAVKDRPRWLVLVPPPGINMSPLLALEGDVWSVLRKVRAARLAKEPPALTAQPVIGWRSWDVFDGKLVSPYQGTPWTPGQPVVAMCDDEPVERVAPDAGIYAARDREHVADGEVIGRVALWGDVLECEYGWIAQYAYPYALPPEWARIYGCEVLTPPKKAPA